MKKKVNPNHVRKYAVSLFLLSVIVVLGSVAVGIYIYMDRLNKKDTLLKSGAKEFAHNFLVTLAINWDPNELITNAHPFLLSVAKNAGQDMVKDFALLSQLGQLREDNCALTNFAVSAEKADRYIVADFACNAVYENNDASIVLQLKQSHLNSPWKVSTFSITPITRQ